MQHRTEPEAAMLTPEEMTDLRERAFKYLWLPRLTKEDENKDNLQILLEGKGARVWDSEGKEYISVCSADWVAAVGFGRKEIADAAWEQAKRLHFLNPFANNATVPTINLATKIAQLAPGSLNKVMFVTGGSEANETGLKLSRVYHQRTGNPRKFKFISRKGCYHGGTFGAISIGGDWFFKPHLYEPLLHGCLHVAYPYCYHCDFGLEYPDCGLLCAKQIEQTIQFEDPDTVAAVVVDAISAQAGGGVAPPEYFPMVREICDNYSVLLIMDEVVCGFGRTGKWFGCEHWNIVPDIMSVAKQLGSGYIPLGASVIKEEIASKFIQAREGPFYHGHTWMGHPVSCAAALVNIDILEKEKLVENTAQMGQYMMDALHQALDKSAIVGDIRGLGLFIIMELVKDKKTKATFTQEEKAKLRSKLSNRLLELGLLIRTPLPLINIFPPLCISRSEIDEIVAALEKGISELEKDVVTG